MSHHGVEHLRPDRVATRQALIDAGVSEKVLQKVMAEVSQPRGRIARVALTPMLGRWLDVVGVGMIVVGILLTLVAVFELT